MRRLAASLAVLLAAPLLAASGPGAAAPAAAAEEPTVTSTAEPTVAGVHRYGRTLVAEPGRWSPAPTRTRYQWLRDGEPVPGATGRRYAVRPDDVGHRLRVEVTAKAPGHAPGTARSEPVLARHRMAARRTVTYSVTTRGRVTADVQRFRRLVQQTYADARGWRGAGVVLRPVRRGGDFTVVLAEARTVPSYSPVCSAQWSCRVGRYVVINQTRWRHASPAWNAADGSLRDYRHMVVNHETGHWLGHGHAGCSGRGRPAPVMMQQSKGLDGCRFNPWPTPRELRATR